VRFTHALDVRFRAWLTGNGAERLELTEGVRYLEGSEMTSGNIQMGPDRILEAEEGSLQANGVAGEENTT
jgi:hypothetical protein